MRKLNTGDAFAAARAIKAAGLRPELRRYAAEISNGGKTLDVKEIGIDTILLVIEMFAGRNAESAVYEVLSGPFEMDPEQVHALPLTELCPLLCELASDEGLPAFFDLVSGILKKN